MSKEKLTFIIKRPDFVNGKFITGKASVRTTRAGRSYMKKSVFENVSRETFLRETPENWRKDGIFKITIDCFFAIEKNNTKQEIATKSGNYYDKKPDCDNIAKGVCDALTSIVYADDARVVSLCVNKYYQNLADETPEVIVTVERLGGYVNKIIDKIKSLTKKINVVK